MPIVTSSIVENAPQRDGRRRVTEAHTDHLGVIHHRSYVVEVTDDLPMMVANGAMLLTAGLMEGELVRNESFALENVPGFTFRHCSRADFMTRMRERFRTSGGVEACQIAVFFLTLDDNQLKTVFMVNDVQLVTLKRRLQNRKNLLMQITDVTGE